MKKAALIIATIALGATAITAPAEARGSGFGPGLASASRRARLRLVLTGRTDPAMAMDRPRLLRTALRLRTTLRLWAALLPAQLLSLLLRRQSPEKSGLFFCTRA